MKTQTQRPLYRRSDLKEMTARIPESVYDRIHDITAIYSLGAPFRDQNVALGITGGSINFNAVDSSVTELVREVLWKP